MAELINSYIQEGKIVPAEITVALLLEAMEKSGGSKFLIDGFPRDLQNIECWQLKMSHLVETQFLLFLDCPEDVMVSRLLERGKDSKRSDDNIESIRKRLIVYDQCTKPVVEHFRSKGLMRQVDSNRPHEEVFTEISIHVASANS
jgi:UMP-CMP kinase